MKDESYGVKLIGHDLLRGQGGIGEGMSLQLARDGRRILWLAHEGAPKNFTGVDVTDPQKPKVVVQTELPHGRSALQLARGGRRHDGGRLPDQRAGRLKPAGIELFDISKPEEPKLDRLLRCSGPHSRGVPQRLVRRRRIRAHGVAARPTSSRRNPKDDQFYRIIDVRNPSKPSEVGRWWYPARARATDAPPPERLPRSSTPASAPTTPTSIRSGRTAPIVGYIDGGAIVLDIADKARPKMVSALEPASPPYQRLHAHGAAAVRAAGSRSSADECVQGQRRRLAEAGLDASTRATRRTSCRSAPSRCRRSRTFGTRGGRFGAHNLHENLPGAERVPLRQHRSSAPSSTAACAPTTSPIRTQPREIALLRAAGAPRARATGAIQINDVCVDERGIVYTVDRFAGGLYILEMNV